MTGQRLTHREMLSYGFKPGEPWAEQRRELQSSFDRAGHSDHSGNMSHRSLSMSSGLPLVSRAPSVQRQHSSCSPGYGSAMHSGYGSSGHRVSPSGRTTYSQDAWTTLRHRDYDHHSSQRSVSESRAASLAPSYASRHSYSHEYAPSNHHHSSSSSSSRSHSQSSRRSGYGYSGSGYSTSHTLQTLYDTDDEDYTPPSSLGDSEPHFSSGYAQASFVIEPSDSGSDVSYSGEHSGDSGSDYESGSEDDGAYSDDADENYDDYAAESYSDDADYSEDGDYYSD
ncbi:hypothetical protein C8R45DRAFT_1205682 [Mycena sanguinolenta]|nr:hypothetical protein C8R45DRAFT_1205682 [Mycena sanguinolenta]